jgi:hypothetical protein
MKPRKSHLFIVLLVALSFVGCGDSNVPMGGRVTYSDNGEPLEKGTVAFTKGAFQARGEIKEDGRYTIGSFKESDGLPKGTYQVSVGATEDMVLLDPDIGSLKTIYRISGKFENPETSGLTAEVDGKIRTFDFEVDRYVPPPRRR